MISIAPIVHWANSIVHWPRAVLSEVRRSGPAIQCKSGQKPSIQNSRNVPEQRAESPNRFLDFSVVEKAGSAKAALNQILLRADSFKSHATFVGGCALASTLNRRICRGQRQHRSRQRPDPETRSAKGGAFSRARGLSQAANRRRWLAQDHAGLWRHVATKWRQRKRISAAKIRAFGRVP